MLYIKQCGPNSNPLLICTFLISICFADNYELVFSALRSDNVPMVDFTSLFLDMTRRCKRDMAILLASRVPDLTVLDLWGENALTLSARHVSQPPPPPLPLLLITCT